MSIIIFDMEWNMGYPRDGEPHFDEIIEIGAVKVQNQKIVATYKEYVRPYFHRVIHHHVRKMVPFTAKELKDAKTFQTVAREFKRWCGAGAQLVSWGNSDISVLESNLARHGMASDWFGECYDLQAGYAYLLEEYTHQYSLKDVVDQFGLESTDEFHDAAIDAYYTALVGIEIEKRYGAWPSTEVIQAKREELRAIHAEEVRQKALEALNEAEPLAAGSISIDEPLEVFVVSSACDSWDCPLCGGEVKATGWNQYAGQGYLTRGRCKEHGWQYPYMELARADGTTANLAIFPATQKIKNSYFRFSRNGKKKR